MKGTRVVVGVFTYFDDILNSIAKVKEQGKDFLVYAPTYIHELDHAICQKRSWVSAFTLTGALTGITFGFSLAIICGLDWPLRVSAKEIVAVPGYFVIGYECNILFGAIFTLIGLLHFCKLPNIVRKVGYDPRFSLDKFGLVVGCEKGEVDNVKALLNGSGADEVKEEDGL